MLSEGPDAAEIVSVAPRSEVSVTFLPGTGVPVVSTTTTVIVTGVLPLAMTELAPALTVDCPGSGLVTVIDPEHTAGRVPLEALR